MTKFDILGFLFPTKCVLCSQTVEEHRTRRPFCEKCYLEYNKLRAMGEHTKYLNADNPEEPIYLFNYTTPDSKRIISELKYRKNTVLINMLARHLSSLLEYYDDENTVITFVPRKPLNERLYGFDQGYLLTKAISKSMNINLVKALIHKGLHEEQKKLKARERLKNAGESYFVRKKSIDEIKNKRVILIDDVSTTGATAKICKNLLLSAGALSVVFACVAKTEKKTPKKNFEKSKKYKRAGKGYK